MTWGSQGRIVSHMVPCSPSSSGYRQYQVVPHRIMGIHPLILVYRGTIRGTVRGS